MMTLDNSYRQNEQGAMHEDRGAAPAFQLRGVRYAYTGDRFALDGITLTARPGERIAILGANGSGKSTLIKLLDGLVFAQEGEFVAFGEAITEKALRNEAIAHRFRRRVGFIFQNSDAQLFSPTVRDEIAFGPLQMGLPPDEIAARIADIAALLDIERLLDRSPFQLSGGEKKKVAIAATLVINPDALLLDEPTNGLDPRSQQWLAELLQRLHGAGKTLITATHDLAFASEIAERAIVFSESHRIEADAPIADVLLDRDLLLRVNLIHSRWRGL